MLNKEICWKCFSDRKYKRILNNEIQLFELEWRLSKVWCGERMGYNFTDKDPVEACPYYLEHIVNEVE